MESGNIIETAKKLGYSIGLDLGAETIIELEMSFMSRLIPGFRNNPKIRMRQHVLLYWDPSYLKSTLIREFSETLPSYLVENISSLTLETLFGSITEDRTDIVRPALAEKKIFKIDELVGFLGTGLKLRDMVNTLNPAMEGDTISRRLIKLAQPDFEKNKIKKLKEEGIDFEPQFGRLSYQPDICVWSTSRPIDNRTYSFLRYSGFLNRFHVLQKEISDPQAVKLFIGNFHADQKVKEHLTDLNWRLARIDFNPIPTPPEVMLGKIVNRLQEMVIDEIRVNKRRLAEIIDIRTKGDILREMSCFALIRTIDENDFREPFPVEYNEEDLEFILDRLDHFVEFKLNPIFAADLSVRRRKKRPRDQAKELILKLLSDGKSRQKKDIDHYVSSRIKIGGATIANALKDLVSDGTICQSDYGFYKLKQDCSACSDRKDCYQRRERRDM